MAIHDPTLRRVDELLRRAAMGLSVEQLTARQPGKWSIADILDHLGRTFSGTALGAHRALDAGRPLARRPTLRERLAIAAVIEVGYFPTGRKSPKIAEPIGVDPADVLTQTLEHLQAMDGALNRAAERFGPTVKFLDHPIIGPLSIRQWRRFHWIHTRHHVRQIEARLRS
jgi:hypothetical protein